MLTIRSLALAFYSCVLLFLSFLSGDAMFLDMHVTPNVVAGEEFDVTINVTKPDIESFARFHVELPRGLEAVSGTAPNADFRADDNSVKFIWMRLPEEAQFTISYRVRVDPRLRGQFTLGGGMSYIQDNARQLASVVPVEMTIAGSPEVPEDQQLDLEEYQKAIPAQHDLNLRRSRVRCIRERPSLLSGAGDYVVRLLVNRGEVVKFAKIEEQLPRGFTAERMGEVWDGVDTYQDGVMRFVWQDLPSQQTFTVAYRLVPDGSQPDPKVRVDGTFSFMQDGATRSIKIEERDVRLENLTPAQLEALLRDPTDRPGRRPSPDGRGRGDHIIVEEPSPGGVEYDVVRRDIPKGTKTGGGRYVQPAISMDAHMLAPEEGIYYRVQVAAGHRPIDIDRYFRRLSLHADVRTERHDGWYKYSVGSFREYKQARDYRVNVWNTTPIHDAFVAAYNNGRRITVQEALMITSQKWYR